MLSWEFTMPHNQEVPIPCGHAWKAPAEKYIFSPLEKYHQQNVWSLNKSKLRWHFVVSEKFETKERAVARQGAVQLPAPTNQLLQPIAIAPIGSLSELLLACVH